MKFVSVVSIYQISAVRSKMQRRIKGKWCILTALHMHQWKAVGSYSCLFLERLEENRMPKNVILAKAKQFARDVLFQTLGFL